MGDEFVVRRLGRVDFQETWQAMQDFNCARTEKTLDEIWLLEHPPVFTLGLAGKPEHLLRDIGVPLVKTDRGGQITYHGPGQLIAYLLLDLTRRRLTVRELVRRMEATAISLLGEYGIIAQRLQGAPGVYVADAKIAAFGLRVRRGCTSHGLALNVDMDLSPYAAINPCGYPGMPVTQLRDLAPTSDLSGVSSRLLAQLRTHLNLGHDHG